MPFGLWHISQIKYKFFFWIVSIELEVMKVFAAEVITLTHILVLRAKFNKFLIVPAKTFLLHLLFELFLLSCSGSDQYSRESFFDLLYELFGLLFFLLTFSLLTSMYSHSLIHILMFICLLRGIHCAFIGHSSQAVVLIYLFGIDVWMKLISVNFAEAWHFKSAKR